MTVSGASVVIISLVITDITSDPVIPHGPKPEELDEIFRYPKIVPNIIPFAPNDILDVQFKEKKAGYGNELNVIDTVFKPHVAFNDSDDSREDESLYTIMLVNVDGGNPHYILWLVTNVVGDGYPTKGDQTVKYEYYMFRLQDNPMPRTHRLVFLVYRQPSKTNIDFNIRDILAGGIYRDSFSIREFISMYNFTKYPTAGNYFYLFPHSEAEFGRKPAKWMLPFAEKWRQEDLSTMRPPWY